MEGLLLMIENFLSRCQPLGFKPFSIEVIWIPEVAIYLVTLVLWRWNMSVCPFCSIAVAPYDPTRVKSGDKIYHGVCHTKKVQQETLRTQEPERRMKQTYFRFNSAQTIHWKGWSVSTVASLKVVTVPLGDELRYSRRTPNPPMLGAIPRSFAISGPHQQEHLVIMARQMGDTARSLWCNMKIDKYFQYRNYSHKRFRDVRHQVNLFLMNDYCREEGLESYLAHNQNQLRSTRSPGTIKTKPQNGNTNRTTS